MHFAAFTYVGESVEDPQKYYRNNVCNTLNLIKVMLEFDVKKFVFSSTCATYGDPVEIPITEDHPQNPISPYGRGKLMVENILSDYSSTYDFKYVSLRYFNAAGADPDAAARRGEALARRQARHGEAGVCHKTVAKQCWRTRPRPVPS